MKSQTHGPGPRITWTAPLLILATLKFHSNIAQPNDNTGACPWILSRQNQLGLPRLPNVKINAETAKLVSALDGQIPNSNLLAFTWFSMYIKFIFTRLCTGMTYHSEKLKNVQILQKQLPNINTSETYFNEKYLINCYFKWHKLLSIST